MRIKELKSISILVIAFFLLFVGCKGTSKKEYQFEKEEFKTEQGVSGEQLKLTNTHMPIDICVIAEKNLLLVIDIRDTNYVKAYDMRTNQFIKGFIKKGAGLNEQLDCHKLQYDRDLQYLYSSDMDKRKIFVYSIDDIMDRSKQALPISEIELEDHSLYRPLLLLNGNWIDYDDSNSDKEGQDSLFCFFDNNGNRISKRGAFPKIDKNYTRRESRTAFEGAFSRSKEGKYIILSYFNTDYIDLYDTVGNLKKRIQGPDIFEPRVKTVSRFQGKMITPDKGSYFAYTSPRMYNDNIYVLYKGKQEDKNDYHANTLFNFDSNLKPKASYKLAQEIFVFDIDWNAKTIYGLTHKYEDNYIVKIKLP